MPERRQRATASAGMTARTSTMRSAGVLVHDQKRHTATWTSIGTHPLLWPILALLSLALCNGYLVLERTHHDSTLNQLQDRLAYTQKLNDLEHLEVARLSAPNRIQEYAVRELGMELPQHFVYSSASH